MKGLLLLFLLLVALVLGAAESAFRLAAASAPPSSEGHGCAVLVLGSPANADGSPSGVARFRVESGVRVYRQHRCSRLVFSGGAVRNEHVEAESMAVLARRLAVPTRNIVIEASARSTWENVGCAAPLVPAADRVLVVSDSLHARRAARYACRQDPGLCERFFPAGVAPPIHAPWKVPAAAYELLAFVRDGVLYRSGAVKDAPRCGSGSPSRLDPSPPVGRLHPKASGSR